MSGSCLLSNEFEKTSQDICVSTDCAATDSNSEKTKDDCSEKTVGSCGNTKKRFVDKKQDGKPKRPRTAYNFFFRRERERILGISSGDEDPEYLGRVVMKKRAHRKVKGDNVMGFRELTDHVIKKWKNLDDQTRKIYVDLASRDQQRYNREYAKWEEEQALKKQNDLAQRGNSPDFCRTAAKAQSPSGMDHNAFSLSFNNAVQPHSFMTDDDESEAHSIQSKDYLLGSTRNTDSNPNQMEKVEKLSQSSSLESSVPHEYTSNETVIDLEANDSIPGTVHDTEESRSRSISDKCMLPADQRETTRSEPRFHEDRKRHQHIQPRAPSPAEFKNPSSKSGHDVVEKASGTLAASMASKLSESELSVVFNMTERLRKKDLTIGRMLIEQEHLKALLEKTEAVKGLLLKKVRETDRIGNENQQNSSNHSQHLGMDKENIVFFNSRIKELEMQQKETTAILDAERKALVCFREKSAKKQAMLEDILKLERQQLSDAENELAKLKAQMAVMRSEKSGLLERNFRLKQALLAVAENKNNGGGVGKHYRSSPQREHSNRDKSLSLRQQYDKKNIESDWQEGTKRSTSNARHKLHEDLGRENVEREYSRQETTCRKIVDRDENSHRPKRRRRNSFTENKNWEDTHGKTSERENSSQGVYHPNSNRENTHHSGAGPTLQHYGSGYVQITFQEKTHEDANKRSGSERYDESSEVIMLPSPCLSES